MPFIPHSDADVDAMLATIGVDDIETLFDEIPPELRAGTLIHTPAPRDEMHMTAVMSERARADQTGPCFLGAGCYDHYIPAAVWDLTSRGEFMTGYTPYQAEASQGTLQLIYEFQTMMAALTGMDVANASVYDGASGLAEAVLMAVRANKKAGSRKVLVTGATHPLYVETARNIVRNQGIEIEVVAFGVNGVTTLSAMQQASSDPVAVIVQQPNFFGMLEDAGALTDWASSRGALVIGVTNPLSLALFEPPSCWGEHGADIVCGDGQPLGIPMSSGGPSFGFICAKRALVRQMPGRIIGATEDTDGKRGYTLTLQAREQHIRRAKATSNICTNQGLLVTAATIHMSLLGPSGLRNVAVASHNRTRQLVDRLTAIEGVERIFEGPYFHEQALSLGRGAAEVVETLAGKGWVAGLALGAYFPDLADACLFCATEQRTVEEIEAFADDLSEVLG